MLTLAGAPEWQNEVPGDANVHDFAKDLSACGAAVGKIVDHY